jgi:hypothetical protein
MFVDTAVLEVGSLPVPPSSPPHQAAIGIISINAASFLHNKFPAISPTSQCLPAGQYDGTPNSSVTLYSPGNAS